MTWWYVNRAAGLVAWALLSASIVFGLLLSSKAMGKKVRPNWLQDLHRGLSGLAVVFVGVHVAGAIGDNYIHFGAADVLVPFASGWRPIAIAWGIVSAYLLLAVELSSLLRKHLSKSTWRLIHFASFPLFLTATAHGITAGTEMGTTIGIAVAALVTSAIAGLTTLRIIGEVDKAKHPPAPRVPARIPTAAADRVPARIPAATVAPRTVSYASVPAPAVLPDVELVGPRWAPAPEPAPFDDAAAPAEPSRSGSRF
jgi:hypothetical protein